MAPRGRPRKNKEAAPASLEGHHQVQVLLTLDVVAPTAEEAKDIAGKAYWFVNTSHIKSNSAFFVSLKNREVVDKNSAPT